MRVTAPGEKRRLEPCEAKREEDRQVQVGGGKRSLGHVRGPWRGIGVRRGIGNAKIYPTGVCLLSLACLIMCLAAGVGILISQSSYLRSPPGKGVYCKEQ